MKNSTRATPSQKNPSRFLFTPKTNNTVRLKRTALHTALVACMGMALLGCSDDDNDEASSVTSPNVTAPIVISDATLIDESVMVKNFSASELKTALETAGITDVNNTQDAIEPICGITVHYINHTTTGLRDEPTNATGAVIMPNGDDEQCQGERPITLYAHGTTPTQSYNLAALDDPDNAAYRTALSVAASYAGQGDILIAPNYPGYDKSELAYAPYVTAKQGEQMLDALHAGKLAIDKLNAAHTNKKAVAMDSVTYGDTLFITGYSQGGYVTMATAKALDELGAPATAISPGSGPYALTAYADSIMSGNVIYGGTVFLPMMASSYQQEYKDIYSDAFEGVISDNYGSALDLFPTNDSLIALFFGGQIPTTQLFQSAPTDYEMLKPLSPPSPKYGFGFSDTNYLFNTDFRAKYVKDMHDNPDGIYPNFDRGMMPQSSNLALRQMFMDNDLRDYVPKAPTLLCGGNQDPSVTYDVNSNAQAKIWQDNTDAKFALIDVDLSNKDSRATQGLSPYETTLPTALNTQVETTANEIQNAFTTKLNVMLGNAYQVAYAKAITDGNSEMEAAALGEQASYAELLSNYHSMIAPYCNQAANAFFDEYR